MGLRELLKLPKKSGTDPEKNQKSLNLRLIGNFLPNQAMPVYRKE